MTTVTPALGMTVDVTSDLAIAQPLTSPGKHTVTIQRGQYWSTRITALTPAKPFLRRSISLKGEGALHPGMELGLKCFELERRSRAYATMIARSEMLAAFAYNLHAYVEHESGLGAGLEFLLHYRKQLDPLDTCWEANRVQEPVYAA